MATNPQLSSTGYNVIQYNGQIGIAGTESVTGLMCDANGDLLMATGITVPSNAQAGFAKGCLFIDTDVASGTTGLNCNKGTNSSCLFTAVTQA